MEQIRNYLKFVKFEHTVFALPFAFLAAVLAADGFPPSAKVLWIAAAMVAGRTYGMGLNRIIDRKIDAENPRTKNRELPQGKVSLTEAWMLVLISAAGLVLAAAQLNGLCLALSPVALAALAVYSFTKRFTWASHLFLGLCYFLIPMAAWIAVAPQWSWVPALLGLASGFWVAGFDILYSLQDMEFDRSHGLYSIPARFGISRSLFIAKSLHGLTVFLLAWAGWTLQLGVIFWAGMAIVAGIIIYEHRIVTPKDLSRVNQAFFTANGWVSVSLFLFTFLDVVLSR